MVYVYQGPDIGELGDRPFRALDADLEAGLPLEIWVDGRASVSATIDVSRGWADFLARNRSRIHRVNLLCGTDLLEVTAAFVGRFTGYGRRLRLFRDAEVFDRALRLACDPGVR